MGAGGRPDDTRRLEGSAANAKSAVHALDIRSRKVLSECMSSPGKVVRSSVRLFIRDCLVIEYPVHN